MQKTSYSTSLKVGIVAAFVLGISVLHFSTSTDRMYLHQIYQRSYYIPIILASFWFEIWGGLATAVVVGAVYLIHIVRDWAHYPAYTFEQYAELGMYLVVAVLAGSLSRVQRKARQRLEAAGAELSAAYQRLNQTFDQLRHSDRLASLGDSRPESLTRSVIRSVRFRGLSKSSGRAFCLPIPNWSLRRLQKKKSPPSTSS